jgi:NDP-sugar pyrophosphorylase family protein
MTSFQALILAGGLGKRLKPVINDRPKPMASLGDKPFLQYQLEWLKRQDIDHLILCLGYRHQQIQDYFGDGEQLGLHIEYSIEEELMGTGGAIRLAERYIRGSFLVLNGDTFFDIDLANLARFHHAHKEVQEYVGSIALSEVDDIGSFGSVKLDNRNRITSFLEKQGNGSSGRATSGLVNAGIYVLEPEILRFIPADRKVSIERETFPAVLESGRALGGYRADGVFIDIGTPEGYVRFKNYFAGRNT